MLLVFSQREATQTSKSIREILLPTGLLINEAQTEIDLQIQELALAVSLLPKGGVAKPLSETDPQLGLLQLGPATQTLLKYSAATTLNESLKPLLEPWARAIGAYSQKIQQVRIFAEAIAELKDIRHKTGLLSRSIDRDVRVAMLELSQKSSAFLGMGGVLLVLSVIELSFFIVLLGRWVHPLRQVRSWIRLASSDDSQQALPPIPSAIAGSWSDPPREIALTLAALRSHIQNFQLQNREFKSRAEKTLENERAMGTLFAGLQVLVKNNEDLLAELIKKEKLASMGEMAAQLAHEIRNPLNALNLKLELLREDLSSEHQKILDRVLSEIDRLNALTESHLRTTRAHLGIDPLNRTTGLSSLVTSRGQGDLSDCLNVIETTWEVIAPKNNEKTQIDFEVWIDPGLQIQKPNVQLGPNILRAVLMNLIKNSVESLEQTGSKKLKVSVLAGATPLTAVIQILDNGAGFPEKVLNEGFQRFLTTKPGGSGLGLTTAQSMLAAFGASLKILDPRLIPPPFKAGIEIQGLKLESPNFSSDSFSTDLNHQKRDNPTV